MGDFLWTNEAVGTIRQLPFLSRTCFLRGAPDPPPQGSKFTDKLISFYVMGTHPGVGVHDTAEMQGRGDMVKSPTGRPVAKTLSLQNMV